MMVKIDKPPEIYQLHIMLLKINPPIWLRIFVHSDSSIAAPHYTLQIAFDWSDFHLHRFLIRGKEYDIGRSDCTCFSTDSKAVCLADFSFRRNECFLAASGFPMGRLRDRMVGQGGTDHARHRGTGPTEYLELKVDKRGRLQCKSTVQDQ